LERGKLLIEQLELAIEELEETQAAKATKTEIAAPETAKEKLARGPRGPRKLPDNLPVERIVEPALALVANAADCACEVVSKTLACEPALENRRV